LNTKRCSNLNSVGVRETIRRRFQHPLTTYPLPTNGSVGKRSQDTNGTSETSTFAHNLPEKKSRRGGLQKNTFISMIGSSSKTANAKRREASLRGVNKLRSTGKRAVVGERKPKISYDGASETDGQYTIRKEVRLTMQKIGAATSTIGTSTYHLI